MVGMLYTVGMVGMVCIIITHEGGVSLDLLIVYLCPPLFIHHGFHISEL